MKNVISPRELADVIGMSESSLKRWADSGLVNVIRTAGGHRRIFLPEAIRYIRESGMPVVNPQPLGISELAKVPVDFISRKNRIDQPLVDAVLRGDSDAARGMIIAMYLAGRSIAEICDGPIARAMHLVGDLWQHLPDGILIEHRATDIVAQAMHQLRTLLTAPAENAPIATGGTPPNDVYTLPSLMVATILRAEGWRDENLSAQVPMNMFSQAARRCNAALVWISVSVDTATSDLEPAIVQLGNELRQMNASLAVGGRAAPPRERIRAENVHSISSMSELAAFARTVHPQKPPTD